MTEQEKQVRKEWAEYVDAEPDDLDDWCVQNILDARRDRDRYKQEAQGHRARAAGDYWVWVDDEENYPESLMCPVLISAESFREILRKAMPKAAQGRLASVDFEHEDCDDDEMMLHIIAPAMGVVGGFVEWRLSP